MMKKQISNKLKTCLLSFSLILSACGGGPDSPLLQNPENREFFQTDAAVKSLLPGVAVSSAHPLATEAGLRTLQNGGNAFDAAVAISAALAVVEPASSGFGGGGFWLLHRESDGKQVVIDGREKAPSAATRDMYLNAKGEVIENLSKVGALAAGIPGMPAALVHINTNYGKLSLEDSLQPALEYAEEGFEMTPILSKAVQHRQKYFSADALKSFVDLPMLNNGLLVQTDLASVIKRLAQGGFNGFYQGETAKKLVEGVNSAGGIWAMSDLQEYNVIERQPVVFEYRDAKIITPPLPSSGGLVLQQILKVLEYKQQDLSPEVTHLDYHLLVESMRRAYRDRSVYMGDPDFISEDVSGLSDSTYIRSLAESIDLNKATPSQNLFDADQQFDQRQQGQDTTHFSVVDAQGNRVSATLSINFRFGSCFIAPGTGIFLNNEMDDFSVKPGTPNGYELVGGKANSIEPGKRPLSSMTPTFIEQGDQVTVIGTPGGSRIISMVMLAILGVIDLDMPIQKVVNLPRFHHQFLPDLIQLEAGAIDEVATQSLTNKGHEFKIMNSHYGNMQAVQWQRDEKGNYDIRAVNDHRGEGLGQVLWQDTTQKEVK